jgi:hypothetical protein
MDYALDGSGELGGRIAAGHARFERAAVEEAGFTVEEYNLELRRRFGVADDGLGRMSYGTYRWLSELEVETEEEYRLNHTYVDTGGEQSSLAYLMGGAATCSGRGGRLVVNGEAV